jgi:hypothetical protein
LNFCLGTGGPGAIKLSGKKVCFICRKYNLCKKKKNNNPEESQRKLQKKNSNELRKTVGDIITKPKLKVFAYTSNNKRKI